MSEIHRSEAGSNEDSYMSKEMTKQVFSEKELLQLAVNASSEGITISTMDLPDRPLIFVNEGFEKLTGYGRDFVVGKNCRFLQGQATNPLAVTQLREAIIKGESCTVELLNYKKSGEPFWNRLSITPIRDDEGKVTHYVGIQSDITDLRNTQVKLKKANEELKGFRDRILKELDQAKIVQHLLLPTRFPETPHLKFGSLFIPMEEIGGDFFDVIKLSDDHYGLLIADVTGHGIPAALLTFMLFTVFKNAATGIFSPAEAVRLTNERLYHKMPGDAFVTMFYAIYNVSSGKLTYTQAGHPEAYVIRENSQEVIPLESEGTLVGAFPNQDIRFSENEIHLLPGDKVILYTDAILDTCDQLIGDHIEGDLKYMLLSNGELPLNELFNRIYEYGLSLSDLDNYKDDFTMLGMEVIA